MSITDIANKTTLPDPHDSAIELPPIIPGSELQLDGDFSAYYYAWLDETIAQNIEALRHDIETRRIMAGYATVNVYTTRGSKANRENIAQLKEYQGKRDSNPEKQARVAALREFMTQYSSDTVFPTAQFEIEADDAMSIRQRECIAAGIPSAIMTKDKDLDMVPGKHINFDSFESYDVPDDYGHIFIDDTKTQKKCVGRGTAFFWAQMLMGDGADDIPGLPTLHPELLNRYKPTQAILKAQATLKNPKATQRQRHSAKKALKKRKPAKIGAVLAHTILKKCKSDKEAFSIVKQAYQFHYGLRPFKLETWRGDTREVTAGDMLLEQARLLWMLRTRDDDVTRFLKERCI